ncbi:uncharacterized [Tachysurus ichikawai]
MGDLQALPCSLPPRCGRKSTTSAPWTAPFTLLKKRCYFSTTDSAALQHGVGTATLVDQSGEEKAEPGTEYYTGSGANNWTHTDVQCFVSFRRQPMNPYGQYYPLNCPFLVVCLMSCLTCFPRLLPKQPCQLPLWQYTYLLDAKD